MKKYLIIIGIVLLLGLGSFLGFKYYLNKDLDNTNWQVTGWSTSSLDPTKANITLSFEDHKIGGNGGVNSYGGDYKLGLHNKITFTNIYSTEMASTDPEINAIESMYFTLLSQIKYYQLTNNTLKLLDENKNELLILEKN